MEDTWDWLEKAWDTATGTLNRYLDYEWGEPASFSDPSGDTAPTQQNPSVTSGGSGQWVSGVDNRTLLLVGGAAVAAYFLFK